LLSRREKRGATASESRQNNKLAEKKQEVNRTKYKIQYALLPAGPFISLLIYYFNKAVTSNFAAGLVRRLPFGVNIIRVKSPSIL